MKFNKLGNLHMLSCTDPVSWFDATFNNSTFSNSAILFGSEPRKELWLASNTVKLPSDLSSSGKQPPIRLFKNMISFKLAILPMVRGMQPLKLLFPNVTTDTVE